MKTDMWVILVVPQDTEVKKLKITGTQGKMIYKAVRRMTISKMAHKEEYQDWEELSDVLEDLVKEE